MAGFLGFAFIFFATLALLLFCSELGLFLGRRLRAEADADGRGQVSMVEGALLGLLALLLGFTFSMAVGRFDSRQQLVVREANALRDAFLRADLLSPEARTVVVAKLREYVDARLEIAHAGVSMEKVVEMIQKCERLHADLWTLAKEENRLHPGAGPSALMGSLVELADIAELRRSALENSVPGSVWVVLFLVGSLSTGSLGFGSGLTGRRLKLLVPMVPVLLSCILSLLLDLDNPRHGLINSSHASFERLRDAMK